MPHLFHGQSSKSRGSSAQKGSNVSVASSDTLDDKDIITESQQVADGQSKNTSGESSQHRHNSVSGPDHADSHDKATLPTFQPTSARRPQRDAQSFLLPTAPLAGSLLNTSVHHRSRPTDSKGKERRHTKDIHIDKRRHTQHVERSTPSAGSSPLTKEVRGESPATPEVAINRKGPALGYGTDPAQIVNLALSLGENRRRYASAGRLSPTSPMRGMLAPTSGRSLSHHLQQPRRTSRRMSPQENSLDPDERSYPMEADNATPSKTGDESVLADRLPVTPSNATLARVEKAKDTLELLYEYRRLLSYLPDISLPSKSRSSIQNVRNKRELEEINGLGRAYNPLQYVRNRKVRWRENRGLDADHSGWRDIDGVRSWVNKVADHRRAGISRIDDAYPLPKLNNALSDGDEADATHMSPQGKSHQQAEQKRRRWRMDWEFTPWDLLADAYWLQEDDNIAHVEDRKGERPFAHFGSNASRSARVSVDEHRSGRRISESRGRFSISSLHPRLPSRHPHTKSEPTDQHSESNSAQNRRAASRNRGRRWPRNIIHSASSSDTDGSEINDYRILSQGNKSGSGASEHAAFEKHMRDLLAQDAEQERLSKVAASDGSVLEAEKKTDGAGSASSKKGAPGSFSVAGVLRSPNHGSYTRHESLDSYREVQGRPSLDSNPENTTPSSPQDAKMDARTSNLLESPNKPFPFRLDSFRQRKNRSRRNISVSDFAQNSMKGSTEVQSPLPQPDSDENATNGIVPTPDSLLPNPSKTSSNTVQDRLHGHDRSSRGKSSSDSRFRGFFRGGRIAEIVGNEVSKVGDLMSRKDASNVPSAMTSPVSSEASDDEGSVALLSHGTTRDQVSPSTTLTESLRKDQDTSILPKKSRLEDHRRRKDSSLSPFQRSPEGPDEAVDPIARQQLEHRERGRSERFHRLAPPRIDLTGVSPSPSPTRQQTGRRDRSRAPLPSRGSSTDSRVYEADRRLNELLGIPGHVGRPGPPVTGLAKLVNEKIDSKERRALAGQAYVNGEQHEARSIANDKGYVIKQDLARLQVTLLSSGVKANELVRRAHEVSDEPSVVLQELQRTAKKPLPRVPRAQEHLLATRVLVSHIDATYNELRDAAEHFAGTHVSSNNQEMAALSEQLNAKHSLASRDYADQVEAVSTQLTTTMTLAAKQLNDNIDNILRRRRRKTRWLRRGGSVLLEWTVLAIMWELWLIVIIFKVVRAVLCGIGAAFRWLFWLS